MSVQENYSCMKRRESFINYSVTKRYAMNKQKHSYVFLFDPIVLYYYYYSFPIRTQNVNSILCSIVNFSFHIIRPYYIKLKIMHLCES